MRDEFSRFHPIVNILYFLAVLMLTMFQMQTGLIVVSLVCALIYHFYLKGSKGFKYLGMVVIMFFATAIINPLFSHKGVTLLFYLPSGNPVTAESLIYGGSLAIMVCGTLLWCSSMNAIITSEKWIEIMGRFVPYLGLLLSMIFRFVPKYTRQIRRVHFAKKAMGGSSQGMKNKVKNAFDTFSITTTWALENSVDTVNSMRARGFGTGKRTTYHKYKFLVWDVITMIWIVGWSVVVIVGLVTGRASTLYYPYYVVQGDWFTYVAYVLLCMTPLGIDIKEALKWHRLKSKI